MKININRFPLTKKSCLMMCFFASMFVFASFTKEDRQKVRAFKLKMMDKYVYHSNNEYTTDPIGNSGEKNISGYKNSDVIENIAETFNWNVLPVPLRLKNKNINNVFDSEEKQGIIGEFSDDESDSPSDNFFTITIPEINKQHNKAYLVYELFGLDSYHSVSRSINKNIAFGGDIIVPSSKWSTQKEEIGINSLEPGKNTILFTSSINGVKYKVKNVKIIFENNFKLLGNVSSLLSDNNFYIKGIDNGSVSQTIQVKDKFITSVKGEYEALVQLTEADKAKGFVSVANSNGIKEYKIPESKSSFKTINEEKFMPLAINILKETEKTTFYENSTITIEKNSVANATQLRVLKLRKKDYPAIPKEIKNMMVNSNAFRLENISGELTKKMIFSFPYDEKKLGARSAKEIKAFYFDYTSKKWKVDPTSNVDTEKKVITVETKGDTDYINGVISVPESSQLESFASTSISGLKAADPTSGLQLMEVPTATQKGDASANYPIKVPAGIGGLQPSLAIGYNSGGGNGWMGDGWNINGLSSITVDTRWGVPTFDGSKETELYSLDGEMLVYPNGYLPHRHNDVSETNTAITTDKQERSSFTNDNVKQFYLRKNHDFTLIERVGTSPSNYVWRVTSTDGTRRYYGGSSDSMLSASGGVAHWGLRFIEDVHGNTMRFTYYNESAGGGQFFQIRKIEYGKNYDYTVNFNRQSSITRKDINTNAKQGFIRSEPYLLKDVEVKYKTELIRTYKMDYMDGEFFKTLLRRIYIVPNNPCSDTLAGRTSTNAQNTEKAEGNTNKEDTKDRDLDDGTGGNGGTDGGIEPTCNEIADSYTFEYYNDVKDNQGNVKLFGPDTSINLQNDREAYPAIVTGMNLHPSKINGNISSESGLNVRAAAGLNFFTPSSDAYGHLMFGFPFGNSSSKARNAQQLVDFNGDGIQDMIYRVPDEGLFLRTGNLDATGNLSFSGSQRIGNYNGGDFSFTETKTTSRGWDMGAIVYSRSQISSSSVGTTKTYLTDANSDGLMDIVSNGEVWFNKYDISAGKSEMTKYSEYTENMVVKAKAIQDQTYCPDPKACLPEPEYTSVVDVVKVWIAPKDGYVRFSDNVTMTSYGTVQNPPQKIYYSVEIQRPAPNNSVNGRIYLAELHAGDPIQTININHYNDYFSQMALFPGSASIDSPERLYVKSGEKIYVRLHKSAVKDYPVNSNPEITYVDANGNSIPNTFEVSQDQFQLNNGAYGNNFLLNNLTKPIYLDSQGKVIITCPRILFPPTSDQFTFRIVTENANTGVITELITPQVYPQSNSSFFVIPPSTITLDVNATEPVYLRFLVESDSYTNFVSSNWNGKITVDYTASTNLGNGQSTNVNVSFLPVPEYPSFAVTQLDSKLDIRNIPNSGVFGTHGFGVQINKNITNFSNLGTGSFYYIVKKGNQVLAKRRITVSHTNSILVEQDMISGQTISGNAPINLFTGDISGIVDNSQLVTVEVYCKSGGDYALFNKYSEYFVGKPFNVYYDDVNIYGTTNATAVNTAMYNTKTPLYNNWGQFLYKPGDINHYTYGNIIDPSAFSAIVSTQNTYTTCQTITNDNAALAACILNATSDPNLSNNTVSQLVTSMNPSVVSVRSRTRGYWLGSGPEQYSIETGFNDDDTVNYFTDPIPDVPAVIPTTYTSGQLSVDTTMKSINRIQKSSSRNTTDGLSYGMGSGGNSETILTGTGSIETQTFSDLNGDGYPDLVYPYSVQFTNSTGSLDNITDLNSGDYPTNSASYQRMNSLGFSYNAFSATGRIGAHGTSGTSAEPDTGLPWSGGASVSAGINDYYNSYDSGKTFWMDVNGDGLPDRIKNGGEANMSVALNLGKSLNGYAPVENLLTYRSYPKGSLSFGIGGALGASANLGALSSFGFGISANVGASASKGTSEVVYEDVNGDGLIDILEVNNSNNSTTVRYNLGNKFNTAVPLVKSGGNIDFTDETQSFNGSVSFGGNYMANIGPITLIPPVIALVLWIKAGAGATVNLGLNVSETRKAFKDMNGDGFTDLVKDTNSGFIVNYSLVGRTNKLKSITNTFSKGKYLLDYEFARANYDNPHAKLVVNKISIAEPNAFSTNYTTGSKMQTNYAFHNRKYDRREREDFGFDTVVKQEMNGTTAVRTSTDKYFNNSYLLNGLIKQSTVQGTSGNISDEKYNYKLRKFTNNTTQIDLNSDLPLDYDSGGKEGRKMAIALLDNKIKTVFESGGDITTTERFSYTSKGLISKYQYTSPSASYNSNITYQTVGNNIIGVPVLIEVYEGTSTSGLLRKRSATNINWNTGKIGTYTIFDGTNDISTDIEYNLSGSIKKITYPPNDNGGGGQRYTIEYTYDDAATGKYVVNVKDAFNIQSSAIYNPLFDVVTRKVDTGGNAMVFYYDGFGRTTSIMGPNEIASNSTVPTVRYRYWLDHAGIPNNDASIKIYRASTSNFDPQHASTNNTIMTDTYSDFLGRVIQVKKDVEIYGSEARSVSGGIVYDDLGRAIQQYHPIGELLGNQNLTSSLGGPFTSNVYDSRDRVISFTDEDGVVKNTTYTINGDLFKTTEEISTEKSESYVDAEGRIVQKDDYLDNQPLTTSFKYNTIGELQNVQDPEGIETHYSYNLAGRRIKQVHPDKGVTSYEYDQAGNLVKLTTDNLLNDPSITRNYIFYKYDYNRLVEIVLPDLPSGDPNPNGVTYEYGLSGTGNNSGKLIGKHDGSGTTKYTYGRMGEVLTESRTVVGHQIPTMYFKTYFNYDSWNRLTKIKYPDNELVLYHYDLGGNLKSVNNTDNETYIQNIDYDAYEQRTRIVYGNGVSQNYEYDDQNRRLKNYNLLEPSNNPMLANSYKYDDFSNITSIRNEAFPLANGMGGVFNFDFRYDTLNRLTGTGSRDKIYIFMDGVGEQLVDAGNLSPSGYNLEMEYNNVGGIIKKTQHHERDLTVVPENTYENEYKYIDGTHKVDYVADSSTSNEDSFGYDYNGNVIKQSNNNGSKDIFWDEQDRMKAIYDDNSGVYQYYTYDDKGERVIKYGLEAPASLYQNGVLVYADDITLVDYKMYPNPYITVSSAWQYTKHYFEGSKRFASKLIDNPEMFKNPDNVNRSVAGKAEEKEPDTKADFKTYLEKSGLGSDVSVELREMWQRPNLYYLHGDHLGTATFVTNSQGEATQFFLNLPFGETMLEQTDGSYNNPYKFNAKELDEDTGLYYYGARYYNPRLSIWYGVDPLAEKYPSLSPYAYVADNPIKYIDPNGKEIVIPTTLDKSDRNKILRNLRGLTNDKISYNETTGKVSILSEGSGNKTRGTNLIRKLISNENKVEIIITKGNTKETPTGEGYKLNKDGSHGEGSGTNIKFNPDDKTKALDIEGKRGMPSVIALGHELLHAEQNMDGAVNENFKSNFKDPDNTVYKVPIDELEVRVEENKLREEHKVTPRKLPKNFDPKNY